MTFTSAPIPTDPIGKSYQIPEDEVLQVYGTGQEEALGAAIANDDQNKLFKDVMVDMEENDWKIYNDEEALDGRVKKKKKSKPKQEEKDAYEDEYEEEDL